MSKRDKRKSLGYIPKKKKLKPTSEQSVTGVLGKMPYDIAELNRRLFGYGDPDTAMLNGYDKKLWEAAMPRLNHNKNFGKVMIIGTGGHDTIGSHFYDMWQKNEKFNIVASSDSIDEESDINVLDLSMKPYIQRMIEDQEYYKKQFMGDFSHSDDMRGKDLEHVILPYSSAVDFHNDWDEDDFFAWERYDRNK